MNRESDSDHANQNIQNGLKGFTAYTKALMLFDIVVGHPGDWTRKWLNV
jgi:hypothetical protein